MARGTTLANLRTQLKAELRDTQEVNSVLDAEYNYALNRKQGDLAFAYDWTFLEHRWDLACAASSRYLAIPTADIRGENAAINFERPVKVHVFYNSRYHELLYGIGPNQYNRRNSDLNQVLDPIQRWQMISNTKNDSTGLDQIEIWPMNASAQTVRFTGQRTVATLAADGDFADLDDLLTVYFVAADYLALRGAQNAPLVLKKANERLARLRAGYPTLDPPVILGRWADYQRDHVRTVPLVVVAGP